MNQKRTTPVCHKTGQSIKLGSRKQERTDWTDVVVVARKKHRISGYSEAEKDVTGNEKSTAYWNVIRAEQDGS